jgi:hypothetical protein
MFGPVVAGVAVCGAGFRGRITNGSAEQKDDGMGIEEAEAAYAEVKNQIAVIGQRFQLSASLMATALTRAVFIMAVHLGDTPEVGIDWLRNSIDTLENDSDF